VNSPDARTWYAWDLLKAVVPASAVITAIAAAVGWALTGEVGFAVAALIGLSIDVLLVAVWSCRPEGVASDAETDRNAAAGLMLARFAGSIAYDIALASVGSYLVARSSAPKG